jgi:hypothetical protein
MVIATTLGIQTYWYSKLRGKWQLDHIKTTSLILRLLIILQISILEIRMFLALTVKPVSKD